jgi:RNA polymerase sigma-70 factor (ECF subfamily)
LEIKTQIDKAKKGDQAAFTFLLNHYWNEVYGFMLNALKMKPMPKISHRNILQSF